MKLVLLETASVDADARRASHFPSLFLIIFMWRPATPVWDYFYSIQQEVSELQRQCPPLGWFIELPRQDIRYIMDSTKIQAVLWYVNPTLKLGMLPPEFPEENPFIQDDAY